MEVEGDQLTAIGTDGRRLAKMTGPVGTNGKAIDSAQTTIIPTRAMQLIERAVAPTDDVVQVAVAGNEFLVHTPLATISARMLEGRFPEWKKVFPEPGGGVKLDLAVGATLTAVRQAQIATSE